MNKLYSIEKLLIILFISYLTSYGSKDTTPPSGHLIDPPNLALITSNHIRLSATANDNESGVKEVRFYASYLAAIDTLARKRTNTGRGKIEHLATIKKPPYEYIWDCSSIPDQDNWRMTFFCDIVDNAGNINKKAGGIHKWIVVDRNSKFSEKKFVSNYTKEDINLDGLLDKYKESDTLIFKNSDNIIRTWSLWNLKYLYFGISVQDSRVISKTSETDSDSMPYWYYDLITIFLDLKNDCSNFRLKDDRQINLSPSGEATITTVEFKSSLLKSNSDAIKHFEKIKDSSYTIEIAIPWKDLGIVPKENQTIGFDMFNVDNDFGGHYRVSHGWSGTIRSNNNNPSEWGKLILKKKKNYTLLLILLIPFLLFIALLIKKLKTKNVTTKPKLTKSQILMKEIEKFTLENAHRSDFSLDSIASFIGLSKDYVRKIIKSETNTTSPQFINNIRIEIAKKLLKTSQLSISEISFKSGYDSLEYFVKVFKKSTDITPSEYRLG